MRTIHDFQGDWRLSRRIEDRRAGVQGSLEGRAVLAPDAAGLTLDERGQLILGQAPPLTATRRYLWRPQGALIAVLFADGRPFHTFVPNPATVDASHACAPDQYRVRYDFTRLPQAWSAEWRVSGPRKTYVMHSLYSRG